jgi:cell division protein FtsB
VRRFLVGFFRALNNLLQTPQKMIWVCLGLIALNLVFDGSLLRLYRLYHDYNIVEHKIADLRIENTDLQKRLKKATDPAFLEREARDRFDSVSEGDLVFVFSEEGGRQ